MSASPSATSSAPEPATGARIKYDTGVPALADATAIHLHLLGSEEYDGLTLFFTKKSKMVVYKRHEEEGDDDE